MYQINLTFLRVRLVSNIRVYINIFLFCFDILIFFVVFFFYVQKLITGLTIRENDQIYEILDGLSLTQLHVRV